MSLLDLAQKSRDVTTAGVSHQQARARDHSLGEAIEGLDGSLQCTSLAFLYALSVLQGRVLKVDIFISAPPRNDADGCYRHLALSVGALQHALLDCDDGRRDRASPESTGRRAFSSSQPWPSRAPTAGLGRNLHTSATAISGSRTGLVNAELSKGMPACNEADKRTRR